MTKQKLQQALKDRDQANQAKEQALQENQVLKKGLETIDSTIFELKKEQAKAPSMPTNPEKVKEETLPTHNLKTEPDPDAHIKYVEQCDACCKTIADTFFYLTTALTNLAHINPKLKEEKRLVLTVYVDRPVGVITGRNPVTKEIIIYQTQDGLTKAEYANDMSLRLQ
jgi:hypothetical protein